MVITVVWIQKKIRVARKPRGFHLVTDEVLRQLPDRERIEAGFLHLFLLHTSASLTINENADPTVRSDMELAFNFTAPEELAFEHTDEGSDDMPAHVKSSMIGNSLLIPIQNGRLVLGTWQGIYLCEHRENSSDRQIFATTFGNAIQS
jgi:secondary thiamine-phosphate synthase enzyme